MVEEWEEEDSTNIAGMIDRGVEGDEEHGSS